MKEDLEKALHKVDEILTDALLCITTGKLKEFGEFKEFLENHHKEIKNLLISLNNSQSMYILETIPEIIKLLSTKIEMEMQSFKKSSLSYLEKNTGKYILKDIYESYRPLLKQKTVPLTRKNERDWKEDARRFEQQSLETASVSKQFNELLSVIKKETERYYIRPRCFISYAWPSEENLYESWVQSFLGILDKHLELSGIDVKIDLKDSRYGNNIIEFMNLIKNVDYVLLIGTESLLEKHSSGMNMVFHELVLAKELKEKLMAKKGKNPVIPLLLSGTFETALPEEFRTYTGIEDFKGQSYLKNLKELIAHLYGFPLNDKTYNGLWADFEKDHVLLTQGLSEEEVTKLREEEQSKQILIKQQIEYGFAQLMEKFNQESLPAPTAIQVEKKAESTTPETSINTNIPKKKFVDYVTDRSNKIAGAVKQL